MKNLSIGFLMVLSLAAFGCKKGADCDKAIANSMELSKADMAKMPGADKMMGKMRDMGLQHCKDDKWSSDAVKCMGDAKTETEAQGCYNKLTADQRDKMNKAMMEMMTPPAGSDMAPPATGSAAMGSDMGSAGSAAMGSAAGDMGSAAGSAAAPK
jgi:hypothetical protein